MADVSATITVAAQPEPLSIEARRTAVIVVDMQNHFVSPGGTFHNSGVDTAPVQAIVPAISRTLDAARRSGIKVIYLRMPVTERPVPRFPAGSRLGTLARLEGYLESSLGEPRTTLVEPPAGPTWNVDIVDELAPQPGDIVVTKPTFSGFYETDLDAQLRKLGINSLVFTGCTTSICVETTLRDACVRGYECLALADCVAEPIGRKFERTNHDASLHVMQTLLGWVTDSTAFIEALAPQKVALKVLHA